MYIDIVNVQLINAVMNSDSRPDTDQAQGNTTNRPVFPAQNAQCLPENSPPEQEISHKAYKAYLG